VKFSLLMPVYAGDRADDLEESISSVANQSVKPDEYIIVKDGPVSKKTDIVLNHWQDLLGEEFRILALDRNVGIAMALNAGLRSCQYDYVARMDADDISLPGRFEPQVRFLEKHPEISLLGAWNKLFDGTMNRLIAERKVPETHLDIVKFSRSRTPFNHATIVFKKADVLSVGAYSSERGYWEDWWLALRLISKGFRLHNLQMYLVHARGGEAYMNRRRGQSYLRLEMKNMYQMYLNGLMSRSDFLRNSMIRSVVRSMPTNLTELTYRMIRKV